MIDETVKKDLFRIIDMYWDDFNNKRELPGVIPGFIPIIWFGDIDAYFKSKIKTVTVALNPSWHEFSSNGKKLNLSYQRLLGADALLSKTRLNDSEKEKLTSIYNNYFCENPYYGWFMCYDTKCMGFISKYGYEVGYGYNCNPRNTAIHIDFYSALPTDPVYGKLKKDPVCEKTYYELPNKDLFKEFLGFLKPNVILFSSAYASFLDCMKLNYGMNKNAKPDIYHKDDKETKLRSFLIDNKLVIHGRNNGQPFAPISDESKDSFFGTVFDNYKFDYDRFVWKKTK